MRTREILGIDIGGVIIDQKKNDGTDTSALGPRYLEATAVPGAFKAIRGLVQRRFADQVYLVSKCGAQMEDRCRAWLAHHRFHQITGVPSDHVRFCRERHQKAIICRELGITHFIDDRLEVIMYLTMINATRELLLFQQNPEEAERYAVFLKHEKIRPVDSWQDVRRALLGDRSITWTA